MKTSDIFSASRFFAYMRLFLAEYGKGTLLIYSLFISHIILFLDNGFDMYYEKFILVFCYPAIVGFSVFFSHLSMKGMGTCDQKHRRNFIILPASRFEKQLGGIVYMVIAWAIYPVVGCLLDFILSLIAGESYQYYYLVSIKSFWSGVFNLYGNVIILSLLLFGSSCLRVGALYFNRYGIFKTLLILTLLASFLIWGGCNLYDLFYPRGFNYPHWDALPSGFNWNASVAILFFALTLFNEWIVYRRLGEVELVNKNLF